MFQSRLSDIVEPRGRANPNSRLIEILARVVDLLLLRLRAPLEESFIKNFGSRTPPRSKPV